jgi:transcription initiation factor IIF auxiliary subunit
MQQHRVNLSIKLRMTLQLQLPSKVEANNHQVLQKNSQVVQQPAQALQKLIKEVKTKITRLTLFQILSQNLKNKKIIMLIL